MALIETESIVLRSYSLAEADKIVVLFTHDHGMVRGVAKGAKRLKSKFGSGLEPFSLVRATYFQKEAAELVSIQHIELIRSYFVAASDPAFLEKFSYLSELTTILSPPHDPNQTLFRMVRSCLETANADTSSLAAIGTYFQLWLLRLTGFLPDWSNCARCGLDFDDTEPAALTSELHLHCNRCRRAGSSQNIDFTSRSILAAAHRLSPSAFAADYRDKLSELAELSSILKRITSSSIGREVVEITSGIVGN